MYDICICMIYLTDVFLSIYIYRDNWRNYDYDSFRTIIAKNIADLFDIATMILE